MNSRLVSLLANRELIELHTTCVCPPIPSRNSDWCAVDMSTFDVDYDYESGRYVSRSPQGWGASESEAIKNLFDQLEAV